MCSHLTCNPEVSHVLPYSMLNAPPGNSVLCGTTIDFWTVLEMFWTEDRVTKWRNAIFPSLDRPSTGVEACFNLICLTQTAHMQWTKGLFALKPISLSPDLKSMVVRLYSLFGSPNMSCPKRLISRQCRYPLGA
jgi:HNH endonuclease